MSITIWSYCSVVHQIAQQILKHIQATRTCIQAQADSMGVVKPLISDLVGIYCQMITRKIAGKL